MLQITDLTYRIAGRILLDGISLTLPDGHHAGLIGRNGTGKSTLLKIIAGTLQADGGEVSMPAGQRLGVLAQEAPDGPESLLETVLRLPDGLPKQRDLPKEMGGSGVLLEE